jgi:hypothetical protein
VGNKRVAGVGSLGVTGPPTRANPGNHLGLFDPSEPNPGIIILLPPR